MYRDIEPLVKPVVPTFPLDDSLYCLDPEETAFFKRQTGIQDEAALKTHIIDVQKEAYKVWGLSKDWLNILSAICRSLPMLVSEDFISCSEWRPRLTKKIVTHKCS
jgi:hypothetical protein